MTPVVKRSLISALLTAMAIARDPVLVNGGGVYLRGASGLGVTAKAAVLSLL
jgi:hypothetical protein